MEQIGRWSDSKLKLSDLRTENLVQLLREVVAHHTLDRCLSLQREGYCPEIDRAVFFISAYDKYQSLVDITSAQLDWMDQHGRS